MDNKFRVLIVDDEPQNLQLISQILQDDYQLAFAISGEITFKVVDKLKPDLILLDIMMPDMDGYEVCKKLKADKKTKDIPIIFITALNDINNETKGLELGAVDYLIKPLSSPIVKARVKNHLLTKKKIERLANLAGIDGLTEIPNRRQFEERFNMNWSQAKREQSSLTLIMIDIDYFKLYNDNYGHTTGDESLIAVAKAINDNIKRPIDFVARYGGEEFVVLLPTTDAKQAITVATNICAAIRELKIPHHYSKALDVVTISLGVSSIVPDAIISKQAFIEQADQFLYQAKRQGRNQIYSNQNN